LPVNEPHLQKEKETKYYDEQKGIPDIGVIKTHIFQKDSQQRKEDNIANAIIYQNLFQSVFGQSEANQQPGESYPEEGEDSNSRDCKRGKRDVEAVEIKEKQRKEACS